MVRVIYFFRGLSFDSEAYLVYACLGIPVFDGELSHRYGLGTCYMRMSKIRLADYHYRKAVKIHPQNAVLLGCVGMVSRKRRQWNLFLRVLLCKRRGNRD